MFSFIRIFTLSFRSFSPLPNTLEFHPGQDYYFISQPDRGGEDDHNYCSSNNMKIMFKILDTENTVREVIGDNRG